MNEYIRGQKKITGIAGFFFIVIVSMLVMVGLYFSAFIAAVMLYVGYLYFKKCDEVYELRELLRLSEMTMMAAFDLIIHQMGKLQDKKKPKKKKSKRRKK